MEVIIFHSSLENIFLYTVKHVLRCHIWAKENVSLKDRRPLKRGLIHMTSRTGQEKGDLFIQVTA